MHDAGFLREILAVEVADTESEVTHHQLFRSLKGRELVRALSSLFLGSRSPERAYRKNALARRSRLQRFLPGGGLLLGEGGFPTGPVLFPPA